MIIQKLFGLYVCLARISVHSGGGYYYYVGTTRSEAIQKAINIYENDIISQVY